MGSGSGKTRRAQALSRQKARAAASQIRFPTASPEYATGDMVLFTRPRGEKLHKYDGWHFTVSSVKTAKDEWGLEIYRYAIAQVDQEGRNVRISAEASDLTLISHAEQPEALESPMLQPAEPSVISF